MKGHRRFLLWLGMTLSAAGLARSILSTALPYIQRSFALGEEDVARIGVWFALSQLLIVPGTWLADRYGHRRVHVAALVVFPPLAFGAALAHSLVSFVALQLGMRVCAGLFLTLSSVLIVRFVPAERRGKAQALFLATAGIGDGLLAAALPLVAARDDGWRYAFVAAGLLGVWAGLRVGPRLPHVPPDAPRAGAGRQPLPPHLVVVLAFLVAVHFLVAIVDGPVSSYTAYHALGTLHLTPRAAGRMVVWGGILSIVAGVLGGNLIDRLGARAVAVVAVVARAIAVASFFSNTGHPHTLEAVAYFAVISAAGSIGGAALVNLTLDAVPDAWRGRAAGAVRTGSTAGVLAATFVVAALVPTYGIAGSVVQLTRAALVTPLLLLVLPRWRPHPAPPAEAVGAEAA